MTTNEPTEQNQKGLPPALKIFIPVALIILAAIGALFVVKSKLQKPASPTSEETASRSVDVGVGATVPDFELVRMSDGKKTKVSEVFASGVKVAMVNFWATWCEACMVEMPSIVNLRKAYKDKGFEVLAVNLDENPKAVVPDTARKLGIEFPIFTDTEEQALGDLFQVHAIPLTVILDRDRKVLFYEPGERQWDSSEVRGQLERWLGG